MNGKYTDDIFRYIFRIREEVPADDIYKNLAEEACELAQAALKMCRVESKTNPTPVTVEEARAKLIEEFTDVLNIAKVLALTPNWSIGEAKLKRWCRRLDEVKGRNGSS